MQSRQALSSLTLGAIGVVFGDIGTSPLYALKEIFNGHHPIPVTPDNIAKVVVNERTGTIVMGGNVSVDDVAITQGGLSIRVQKRADVSQPDPLSYGSTIVANNTNVKVKDSSGSTIVLPATANVSDIVGALNAVGATPRDTISILQAMKASGALHAELELI